MSGTTWLLHLVFEHERLLIVGIMMIMSEVFLQALYDLLSDEATFPHIYIYMLPFMPFPHLASYVLLLVLL
jgi:hypothetical protein